jgi:hypothetical protein
MLRREWLLLLLVLLAVALFVAAVIVVFKLLRIALSDGVLFVLIIILPVRIFAVSTQKVSCR